MMRILVIGRDGQVGRELQRTLPPLGDVLAVDVDTCDLAKPAQLRQVVRAAAPQLIVNAAAYTAVDQAESDAALAFAINADAPALLAEEAGRLGAALIHYSTDYVFDGDKTTPYRETDSANPLSVYGRSKLKGDEAIAASGVAHLVLRTSWVYARQGKNFLVTMSRLARERPELRVVADQTGTPNWAGALAEATAQLVGRAAAQGSVAQALAERGGLFNLSCGGATTWHGFASAIVERLHARGEVPLVPVLPIGSAQYPTPVRRPTNSVLDPTRLEQVWGLRLPDWQAALDACLAGPGPAAP